MYKRNLLNNNNSISKEIEKRLKNSLWDSLSTALPKDTLIVGGFVRDVILNKLPKKPDIDLVVKINPVNIANKVAEEFKGKLIILDKKRNIVRIIFEEFILDIAQQVGETLIDDLTSRDFTINSIAFSLDSGQIIDPTKGIPDLRKGLIRTCNFQNLLSDPLRMLRCFRFISELNFAVDKSLFRYIKINKHKLISVSGERIQYELKRIFKGQNSFSTVQLINKMEIFDWIQSYRNFSLDSFKSKSFINTKIDSSEKYLVLFYLIETLDLPTVKKFKFSKSDIQNAIVLTKWRNRLNFQSIDSLNEIERYDLHKDLEHILPSLIFYLPQRLQSEWISRWQNKNDRLFHPKNIVNGELLKKYINIQDGPLLGKLLKHLSIEFAYERLNTFDEAIYNAKQWFEQNAPKCD